MVEDAAPSEGGFERPDLDSDFIEPAPGTQAELAAIRTSDVQAWVKGLTKTQKPSTVKVVASNLSGVMKAAQMDRLISVNPCTGVKLPKNG